MIIFTVCIGAVFSTDASPKIRSRSVTLNVKKATIGIGDIVTLDAVMSPTNSTDTIRWTSSNKKIATVNKYGVVTALKEGRVTITARTSSRKTAKCVVTVKNHLSKSEITALISKKCLSEETVKRLIKENTLSETDVKRIVDESISKSTGSGGLSEETVKRLIKENTLSEADVKRIVDEGISEGTSDADWADGTELKRLPSQSLPLSVGDYAELEKITVRKYRYDGEWNGRKQKYKYTIEIEGSLTDKFDSTQHEIRVSLKYMNKYEGDSLNAYDYYLKNATDTNSVTSYQENGGKFVLTAEQYSIYSDYDEYMVYDLKIFLKP